MSNENSTESANVEDLNEKQFSLRLYINEIDAADILRQLQPDAPFPAINELNSIELVIRHEGEIYDADDDERDFRKEFVGV